MSIKSYKKHWECLTYDFHWLAEVLKQRDADFRMQRNVFFFEEDVKNLSNLPINPEEFDSPYSRLLQQIHANTAEYFDLEEDNNDLLEFIQLSERVILLLALAPHIKPELLDYFKVKEKSGRDIVQFGGIHYTQPFKGFIPTGQTATHVLAGNDLERRCIVQDILSPEHLLAKQSVLEYTPTASFQPLLTQPLALSEEYKHLLTSYRKFAPQYSPNFPATILKTNKTWDDLFLNNREHDQVQLAKIWVKHYEIARKAIKDQKDMKGYRCLLYGEPGTGKTLTNGTTW